MEYIKLLKDYSKTPLEIGLSDYLTQKLVSVTCCEKIKNKDFMLQYIKPVNDFVIFTNALPNSNAKRITC